ncbi:polysaccharide deacetylase family protein [Humitalea sp. 24SJ18S-53]|uniref:polysaccharide deacetylase family protein n=1 Tax=Humitalea sp. 24SJ18S-53 TaxID=3422307 RepID=UPI003D666D99
MTGLPDSYMQYPWRRRGLDHDRFAHRNLPTLRPVTWPGGARVALWVAVHAGHFPMDMPLTPILAPGGMERPYPSYWDYTQRDYGNRVGIYRLMRVLAARNLPATALMSAALAPRYPALVRDIKAAGWEVAAAGVDMGKIHHGGVDVATERALVQQAVTTLREAFGPSVRGWHSPAFSESAQTLDLIAEAGIDYVADWVNDEMPYAVTTSAGPLTAMPLPYDLSDQRLLFQQHMATEDFCAAILAAHSTIDAEARATGGGRILTLAITPWLMGQPHRIRALAEMLDTLLARGGIWPATGAQILDAWTTQAA